MSDDVCEGMNSTRPVTTQLSKKPAIWLPAQKASLRTRSTPSRYAGVLVFSVAILLALSVRLINLNEVGYNSDEAVYAGQGAAIAQVPILSEYFPVFRAHPLLFQFILALVYKFGMNDMAGRLASVAFGVATVGLVYLLGNRIYGRTAGLFAALFLAVMPYHVIPTRQVLLDGPMVFWATLTLYLMVMYGETQRPAWLYGAGAGMGLTVLTKETGIVMVGAIYAFLALTPALRVRVRDLFLSIMIMVAIMAVYPLTTSLAGGAGGSTDTAVSDMAVVPAPQPYMELLCDCRAAGHWLPGHCAEPRRAVASAKRKNMARDVDGRLDIGAGCLLPALADQGVSILAAYCCAYGDSCSAHACLPATIPGQKPPDSRVSACIWDRWRRHRRGQPDDSHSMRELTDQERILR